MKKPSLAAFVFGARPSEVLARLSAGLARLVSRQVEIVVALRPDAPACPAGPWRTVVAGGTVAAARNAAVAAAVAGYGVFVDPEDDLDSSFLEHACRLLDGHADVELVSSWGDGAPVVPASVPQPLDMTALLSRPWLVHLPTVFRRRAWERVGGYDAELVACEDVDFLLRVAASGGGALGLAEARLRTRAWGEPFDYTTPGALEAGRRLWDKHRERFEERAESVLLGKERIIRELHAVKLPIEAQARAAHREAEAVERTLAGALPARGRTAEGG